MVDILFDTGLIFTILALVGLVGVLVFLATTALRFKAYVTTNAGRLYKRPLAAGKNLVTTVKGIAQQETLHAKHIGASAKAAGLAVKDTALTIKDTAQSVHPEHLKPALSSVSNIGKTLQLAVKLSHTGAAQKKH